MEEITGYVFRNLVSDMFGEWDKVFSPFITPMEKKILKTRERRDVDPGNNKGRYLVPQILTNSAERFVEAAVYLYELGYREINLNMGCPSGTVVAKERGSGMLRDIAKLDRFLSEAFSGIYKSYGESISISVKTRAGISDPAEFEGIYETLSHYPFSEIIIHPRVQKDFYESKPHMEAFDIAVSDDKYSLCYNGDLFTVEDINNFATAYPDIDSVMFGRGVLINPGLLREIRTGTKITMQEMIEFHDRLYDGYTEMLGADKDVLFKMKEPWSYWQKALPGKERQIRKILRTRNPVEYKAMVREIFLEHR